MHFHGATPPPAHAADTPPDLEPKADAGRPAGRKDAGDLYMLTRRFHFI